MHRSTLLRLLAGLLGALLVLAACGDDEATDAPEEGTLPPTTAPAGGDGTTTTAPAEDGGEDRARVVEATVAGGEIQGPGRVEVDRGTPLRLVVSSDVDDELHVHGYDLVEELAAGETAELSFTADLPGVFEVELHGAGLLFELAVT